MALRLLPIALMVCGIAFATQTANAQTSGWNSGCQSNAPAGPEPSWNGPSSYQPPGPGQRQVAPPPAPQAPGTNQPANQRPAQGAMNDGRAPIQQGQMQQGQMQQGPIAQNGQPYQSFSAEPQAAPVYGPNTYTYPMNGGYTYGGYYGNPYYGGNYSYPSYGGGWNSELDNGRFHGINPNAYP